MFKRIKVIYFYKFYKLLKCITSKITTKLSLKFVQKYRRIVFVNTKLKKVILNINLSHATKLKTQKELTRNIVNVYK